MLPPLTLHQKDTFVRVCFKSLLLHVLGASYIKPGGVPLLQILLSPDVTVHFHFQNSFTTVLQVIDES